MQLFYLIEKTVGSMLFHIDAVSLTNKGDYNVPNMSSMTLPANPSEHPQLRPLNIFRDLSQVADLIEMCFAESMDHDGQRYIDDMRRASRDDGFLNWATRVTETASLPLMGFVWEEENRIVGNASLIPFRDKGRRVYLIANIAVHPDHRRRGIARLLTRRAVQYGWSKKAQALWLHVRDDNPGAIALYGELGFEEIVRRTTWNAKPDNHLELPASKIQIVSRHRRFWPQQQNWLRRLHPDLLNWYRPININALQPGLLNWLYLLFVDMNIRQWAAVRENQLLATLSSMPYGNRTESLAAATVSAADQAEAHLDALTLLLLQARKSLYHRSTLSLEYPAGEMTEAFRAAGFNNHRTLLWMRALPATQSR